MLTISLPFAAFWAFLGLKLSGAWATVGWVWIFAPLWVGAGIAGIVLAAVAVSSWLTYRQIKKHNAQMQQHFPTPLWQHHNWP